jgi:tetratricopeptide (TPR) repeat protein
MKSTDELSRLQVAAERAVAGYHHKEAIALYTEALEIAPLGDDPAALTERYELLYGRGNCYEWIGNAPLAMADFEAAVLMAEAMPPDGGDLARQADALNQLANLTGDQVGISEAEELAEKALKLARQIADSRREADSLKYLSQIQGFKGNLTETVELLQQALVLYRQTGDKAGEGSISYFPADR